MLNKRQNILNYLHTLKSFGYEYIDDSNNINKKITNQDNVYSLPNDLDTLRDIVLNCSMCNLSKSRNHILFDNYSNNVKVMFVGDMPTVIEDEYGKIAIGNSGDMLKNMIIKVLELSFNEVYITNLIKCYASSDDNFKNALTYCLPYIHKQMQIIKPKIIVCFAPMTYNYLFNDNKDFDNIKGKVMKFDDYYVLSTYHPMFLLRNPSMKKDALLHLKKVKNILKEFV
jgi:DNA polymerase